MTTVWDDPGRLLMLRAYWVRGMKARDIASKMRCFAHCEDRGTNAVIGMVNRLRSAARRQDDKQEEAFWTREKKPSSASSVKKKRPPKKEPEVFKNAKPHFKENRSRAPLLSTLTTAPIVVVPPTAEEVTREAARQIMLAANAMAAADSD